MGYAISSKNVVGSVNYELFTLDWDYTEQTNNPFPTDTSAAGDESNILFKSKLDVSNIKNIQLLVVGKKKTDVSDNNHLKVAIDTTDLIDQPFTDTNEVVGKAYEDISGYNGIHTLKLYTIGGTDYNYYRYIKLWIVMES